MEITKEKAIRLAVISVGAMFIASCASPTYPDLANAQQNNTLIPGNATEEKNKALVLKAFDTLFNQRDYVAAESYWSPKYIQHSAHIEPGREGLFNLVKSSPPTLKYEPGTIVADGDCNCPRTVFGHGTACELDCSRHPSHRQRDYG